MNVEEAIIKLADTQTGQEARLVRLETAFQSVAQSLQMLIEMAAAHEERLDAHDEARTHTDARLDALIDSQIKLDERFAQMTTRFDQMAANWDAAITRIDQMAVVQAEHSAAIRALLERNGH